MVQLKPFKEVAGALEPSGAEGDYIAPNQLAFEERVESNFHVDGAFSVRVYDMPFPENTQLPALAVGGAALVSPVVISCPGLTQKEIDDAVDSIKALPHPKQEIWHRLDAACCTIGSECMCAATQSPTITWPNICPILTVS